MKYFLILSVAVNIFLLLKLAAMRISIREIRTDFSERVSLNSNTLLRVSSRDKEIRSLAQAMNETLISLRDAFHKYERGDAEIKAAITNIAHDLRTPLTAICGYLELGEKLEKSPELERYLSVIAERAGHMKKLTEELFEYALISGGEVREEEQLDDNKKDKDLDGDDEPQRLAHSHAAESIIVQVEHPGPESLLILLVFIHKPPKG